jgi:hypothetical protein
MPASSPSSGLGAAAWSGSFELAALIASLVLIAASFCQNAPRPILRRTAGSEPSPRPRLPLRRRRRALPVALKLSFDGRLIYNRPYLYNLLAAKFIDDILSKENSLAVHMEAKELSLWRTVET